MAPIWDPKEASSKVYRKIQKHSDGMISFTYEPPSKNERNALRKRAQIYRNLVKERDQTASKVVDTDHNVTGETI